MEKEKPKPIIEYHKSIWKTAKENTESYIKSDRWAQMSIAAPCIPVIAALMCTTKRSVEGFRILDLLGHQDLI